MDLLEDIFAQPTETIGRLPGKFQPKIKKKSEQLVLPPLPSTPQTSEPCGIDGSNSCFCSQESVSEDCLGIPSSFLVSDGSISKKNDELHTNQKRDIFLSGDQLKTLDSFVPSHGISDGLGQHFVDPLCQASQPALVEEPHCRIDPEETTVNSSLEQWENVAFHTSSPSVDAHFSSQNGDPRENLIPSPFTSFEPSDSAKIFPSHLLHGNNESLMPTEDSQFDTEDGLHKISSFTDQVKSQVEVANMFYDVDSFDDFIVQPTNTAGRDVGKFKPKGNTGPKTKKIHKPTSFAPDNVEVPVISSCNSKSLDRALTINPAINIENSHAEVEASEVPLDDITQQNCTMDTLFHEDSHFCAQSDGYTGVSSSPCLQESSYFFVAEDPVYSDSQANLTSSGLNRDLVTEPDVLDGENATPHSQGVNNRNSDEQTGEEGAVKSRQLRKRIAVHTPVYNFNDESNEDLGIFNTHQSDEENNDNDYIEKEMPVRKKVLQKSNGLSDDKQKPTQKCKKISDDVDLTKQEPPKRKFSHSTRRNKRRVDKVLLETPDDEIDERNIPIKDLILLSEARERLSIKEAAMSKQSSANRSSSHVTNDNYFEDNMYGEGQDINLDDNEDGANPQVKLTSTKFNYHSFMNKPRSLRWSKLDTDLFYQAIRQFGTDFAMIQQLFPDRTRHQVKLKFKNEERKHPLQIADAIVHRSKDVSQFEHVIRQLQVQAEQNSDKNALSEEPSSESQQAVKGDEDQQNEIGKSEYGENEVANDFDNTEEQQEANDDMEQNYFDVKYDEYENIFDFNESGDEGKAVYDGI